MLLKLLLNLIILPINLVLFPLRLIVKILVARHASLWTVVMSDAPRDERYRRR